MAKLSWKRTLTSKREGYDKMVTGTVMEVIKENYEKIFSAEKKVADFVLKNATEVIDQTVSELAKASGVSDATVVRMCHHLGYKGYYQFRLMLAKDIGREETEETEANAVSRIFQEYANDITSIGENMDHETVSACVNLIKSCHQVHIIAVGNTTPLSLYMGFRLGRIGVNCTYAIAPEYFLNCINLGNKDDIILAISQSGSSRQIIQGIELGKEKGMKSIAITAYKSSPVAELADYVLVSNGSKEAHGIYKNYAHLKETAIIDALLEMVTNWEKIKETDADKPEVILSEYKY